MCKSVNSAGVIRSLSNLAVQAGFSLQAKRLLTMASVPAGLGPSAGDRHDCSTTSRVESSRRTNDW